jgi:putative transposase
MCRVLGVKSNNYYSYQKRKANSTVDPDHDEMIDWIQKIAKFCDYISMGKDDTRRF